MNLTAIRDPEGVARLHMLDCAPLLLCAELEGKRLMWAPEPASPVWC